MPERRKLEALKQKVRDLDTPELLQLGREFQSLPPHDVADILESLDSELQLPVLLELDPEFAGEVLVELNEDIETDAQIVIVLGASYQE